MTEPSTRTKRVLQRVRTTLLVMGAVLSMTIGVAYYATRAEGVTRAEQEIPFNGVAFASWWAGLALCVLLIWRHRWPWVVLAVSCLGTLFLPIDGFLPLAALYAVLLVVVDPRRRIAAVVATAVAVFVSVLRDTNHGVPEVSSFWRTIFPYAGGRDFPWWLTLLITLVVTGITAALALYARDRRTLSSTTKAQQVATQRISVLSEEVARRAERERIAREIHDALGHRLSLLNLHAGALELSAGDDPKLAKSARVVRESAQQSMADLRSLLTLLREPGDPDVSKALLTLSDLPTLIDESLAAGSPVASSVFIDESQPLDEQVSHTVFRITQELLTNARKHSPGSMIRLHLDARPTSGIEISTTNRMPPDADRRFRPGNGLTGIHERVTQCGGESWAWVDEGDAFRFLVRLPWQFRPAGAKVKS
ncbi:sensor histidine kinase [Yimella sp. cx-51]|uniref:sensor histidine kinase n=1 Tax=Yimella sp. cx-51 TaxID=2770551 RepID=UPI00165E0A1D|nr:histidine kinase [Yimella sp. cx-51]MBC9955570.1 hypothetical protein [Yimella sp. cx-51]QTH37853.1 hypothetical protein J5M86_13545 [Yimella sp. cx-51]